MRCSAAHFVLAAGSALCAQQFALDPVRAQLPEFVVDGRDVELADLDVNGDLDLDLYESLCCTGSPICAYGTTRILVNRHRQLAAPTSPRAVRRWTSSSSRCPGSPSSRRR
ncbi:MAG: hypothetical protein HZB39_06025 [Planctomycetes bacterium]|nr:hypothetical protein [Planctomycetota bacterium]